jgi:GxxExxY protein
VTYLFEDNRNDSRKGAKIAKMDENSIGEILDAAIAVHRDLDSGLLETVYEVLLFDEIRKRGFRAERQMPIAIVCQGARFDEGFRADIVVDSKVIIELKSVERITNAHKKQLQTHLKVSGAVPVSQSASCVSHCLICNFMTLD